MTSTNSRTREVLSLLPALRAIDEKVIRERGPAAAIVASPSERTALRRASIALGQHRQGFARVGPVEVALALYAWDVTHQLVAS